MFQVFYNAISRCGNGGTIVIPAGQTFNLRSTLNFSRCASCDFQIEGMLKFSNDLSYWNGTKAMFKIDGVTGLKFRSLSGSGVIDANGQAAWESFSKDKSLKRPTLHVISNSSKVVVSGLTVRNPQGVFFSVGSGSTSISYTNLVLSAISSSATPPKNTDGFDIGECDGVLVDNISVKNQDDCVAFKPAANHVTVTNIVCEGSHGLSVGSLGHYHGHVDTVENVYVKNAVMRNSSKAAGVKIYPGGPNHGSAVVKNVTWDSISVENCDYAFQFSGCYNEDEAYCQQYPTNSTLTGLWSGTSPEQLTRGIHQLQRKCSVQ